MAAGNAVYFPSYHDVQVQVLKVYACPHNVEEILHQLVDGLSSYNPIIYSVS